MFNTKILSLFLITFAFFLSFSTAAEEDAPAYRLIMPEGTYEYFKEEVFQGAKRIDWFDFEMGVKLQFNKTAVQSIAY